MKRSTEQRPWGGKRHVTWSGKRSRAWHTAGTLRWISGHTGVPHHAPGWAPGRQCLMSEWMNRPRICPNPAASALVSASPALRPHIQPGWELSRPISGCRDPVQSQMSFPNLAWAPFSAAYKLSRVHVACPGVGGGEGNELVSDFPGSSFGRRFREHQACPQRKTVMWGLEKPPPHLCPGLGSSLDEMLSFGHPVMSSTQRMDICLSVCLTCSFDSYVKVFEGLLCGRHRECRNGQKSLCCHSSYGRQRVKK